MPRPKKIDRYPRNYFTLMERGYKGRVPIECRDSVEAVNLRAELYTFRAVLIANPSFNPRAAYCASHVRFKVIGNTLVAEPKPSSNLAPALRADQERRTEERANRMRNV